jgi:hypothetical protein
VRFDPVKGKQATWPAVAVLVDRARGDPEDVLDAAAFRLARPAPCGVFT